MKRILFACTHNAGRSQMAAAFFNQLADPAKATALSAGTQPTDHVHPVVATVMWEVGIDLSTARRQRLTPKLAQRADVLVAMGCGEQCPFVLGVEVVEWESPDPKDRPVDEVRSIRDEIAKRVRRLVRDRDLS